MGTNTASQSGPKLQNLPAEVLVQHSPIFDVRAMCVKPVSTTKPNEESGQCPSDFARVMGAKLPAKLYTLVTGARPTDNRRPGAHLGPDAAPLRKWTQRRI